MKMKINTYNYMKGKKIYMIKNIIDADLNIYVLDRTYDYQLWETDLSHDISSDSYLGNGTIKRPVGLIITVSKNS